MQITSVDQYNNLFRIENVFPTHIVEQVLNTDWLSLPWQRQEGQESWARRRINETALSWMSEWDQHFISIMPDIEKAIGRKLQGYQGTGWWVDEPGFTCAMHTDGEMPGSCQLTWIGALPDLGTSFYHYKDPSSLRYNVPMQPNAGYLMINTPDLTGFRHLQWHAMLTPVPPGTFRLNSYTWLSESK
jgi:hypothetical protein